MNRGWIGLLAIVALAGGVLAAKALRGRTEPAAVASAPAAEASLQVFLFADPREAEASCGCGLVFRAVRTAAARGVAVREIDPRQSPDLVRDHRITVQPTVLVLDHQGRELRRHEGESTSVIEAIRADLDGIPGTPQ